MALRPSYQDPYSQSKAHLVACRVLKARERSSDVVMMNPTWRSRRTSLLHEDTKKGASRSMDITTRPMIEKENEAVALATVIFAAGFFLGIGTGMLLGSSSGSGVRGRLREVVDHLLGDATKGLTNVIETGSGMLTKGHMSDHA